MGLSPNRETADCEPCLSLGPHPGATSVLKLAKRGVKLPDWLVGLMARKPVKLVAVALANKIARVIWALLVKGGFYKKPTLASTTAA